MNNRTKQRDEDTHCSSEPSVHTFCGLHGTGYRIWPVPCPISAGMTFAQQVGSEQV